MEQPSVHALSERFTRLSDRFRSLWTFYQFLSGVYKHRGEGTVPFTYDFQALYRRVQELVPRMGVDESQQAEQDFNQLSRELDRIQGEMVQIEHRFPPSLLRRFFDHLKRQDEKILYALVKFYLLSTDFAQDTLDKLDILLTRIAEAPLESGRTMARDPSELRPIFQRLAAYAQLPPLPEADAGPLVEAVRDFRGELRTAGTFDTLIDSRVFDRYRQLKQQLGKTFLNPPILVEAVITNIEARNQFDRLFREEEARILEQTNRVFEIERFLERNPDVDHATLRSQIEDFRTSRMRLDSSRREDNVKREDIVDLRRAMDAVLESFRALGFDEGPSYAAAPTPRRHERTAFPTPPQRRDAPSRAPAADPFPDPDDGAVASEPSSSTPSITEILPSDPLLTEPLHKIMFAIEMVAWDRSPDRVVQAPELHNLRLEPWEVASYRELVERKEPRGTTKWELEAFFLRSAALRIKMEEERQEIQRLHATDNDERAFDLLERSAQSLERARDIDRRFQWFIDDMLYSGDTEQLEQLYRSRFRFLHAYSALWLEHQARGGLTPL